jgi:hypothetical protein
LKSHLPKDYRPKGVNHKILVPGLHLPADFIDSIKGIDQNLHFVFHHYRVQYDDLMNCYYGSLEDPRWMIHAEHGTEVWGWIMTMPDGSPIPDMTWHLWQLKQDWGWSHVANIPDSSENSLNTIVNRLGKEKLFKAKFGALAWNYHLRAEKEDRDAREMDAKDARFQDIQRENSSLTRKAMENLAMGITKPTNPTTDVIASYKGQTNFTKITRPITDKEGGLVTGED